MARTGSLLSLLLTVWWALGLSLAAHQDCLDIPTETNFQPEDVEGMWYPMEIVLHRNDSKIYGVPVDSQCPVVTISRNKRALVMVWNATNGDVKFTFNQQKGSKAQWQANGEQTGSLVNDQYKHYGGVVKVLKVDSKYVFLSYCSSKFRMLSTLALSRDEEMSEEDLKDTLEVLDTRGIKRAREIHVRPCEVEEPSGQAAVCSWFPVVLFICVLWLAH